MGGEICPECGTGVSTPANRLVQDSCGHKKCRKCLLRDDIKCKLCVDQARVSTPKESVIKCSSELKQLTPKIKIEEIDLPNVKHEVDEPEFIKQEVIRRAFVMPQHVTVSKDPVSYTCTMCRKSFTSKSNVRYHVYCAGEKKPLQCGTCGKEFITSSHLKVHCLTHTNTRPHVCETCGKSFIQKGKLNRHKQLHSGVKSYACKECEKSFFNKDALRAHAKIHSFDGKEFPCKICTKKFSNSSNLNKHMNTHSTEKTHMCDQCGKSFKIKWGLTVHRRSHLRQKPHHCPTCPKSFTNTKDLNRHKLTHLDIKPYNCGACGVSFRRKDNLERHIKNSHPGKEVAPVVKKLPVPQPKPVIVEKPNAIKVITAATSTIKSEPHSKPVPVINGPFKLAFKTSAFKNNYNILRDYSEPPKILPKKPYDLAESVNICQRILSPHSPVRITRPLRKDTDKMSAEICQKIMTPTATAPTTLHYETSFEHKKHAIIKNIKFKLPSNYTNIKNGEKTNDYLEISLVPKEPKNSKLCSSASKDSKLKTSGTTSVIVNNNGNASCVPEMHWRRRTLQNLHPKYST